MISYSPLLCLDFYKTAHAEQYPAALTKMVSYYTPRMTRLADTEKVTMFGLQAFIQEYLIEVFNTHFFDRSLDEVLAEYKRVLNNTIGTDGVGVERLTALHKLGYLPLEIRAVPEGTRTNIHVPQIEISNTNPNFVWLVNSIETMLSCTMWHTQISAEAGYRYRQIVNKYAALTCDDDVVRAKLLGDFSMRGQESVESATKSSAAFCLSFLNTATVPAKVVLSSDWRYDRDDPRYNGDYLELEAELLKYGVRLYGFTPELPSCHRGMEIDCWLKEHSEVGDFVLSSRVTLSIMTSVHGFSVENFPTV